MSLEDVREYEKHLQEETNNKLKSTENKGTVKACNYMLLERNAVCVCVCVCGVCVCE